MNYALQYRGSDDDIKGDVMKKSILFLFVTTLAIFTIINGAHALDIDGWWKATMQIEYSDLVTGEWETIRAIGTMASYLYFFNVNENTFSGAGYLILNRGNNEYYTNLVDGYYTVYFRNNVVVLFIQSGLFPDGIEAVGSTIVLKAHSTPTTVTKLTGYYTEYDIENTGTPEQFIRMGTISATRVNVEMVPEGAKNLIP
jgi:hypothetical protein